MSKNPLSKSACTLALLIFCLAFGAVSAAAQSTTQGAVGGTVKDPQGAVVANAPVTVKNEETNKEFAATTDDEGRFRVVQLDPGTYSVTVSASGFAPYTQQKVVVEVGRVTPLDINVSRHRRAGDRPGDERGAGHQHRAAGLLDEHQPDVDQRTCRSTAAAGRTSPSSRPARCPTAPSASSRFRGISGLLNNNTIDGGDNNQAFFAEERGRTRISYSVSQSAIREFQVNTSSYSAEYGRSAGGVVNAVTKCGTNEFHGDVFYYQRNNKWGARNPLATNTLLVNGVFTPVGIKPKDVRHQFGGTIGGPIVKDKAFFFFTYDQQKRDFPGLARFTQGNFLNTVNRTLLTDRGLDRRADRLRPRLPQQPDRRGHAHAATRRSSCRRSIGTSTTRTRFTATYNRLRWDSPAGVQTQATNTRAPRQLRRRLRRHRLGDAAPDLDPLSDAAQRGALPVGPRQRGSVQSASRMPASRPTPSAAARRRPSSPTALSFGIPDFLERPSFPDERRNQFADTMTYSTGNHTFKFGGDINFVKDIINNLRFLGRRVQLHRRQRHQRLHHRLHQLHHQRRHPRAAGGQWVRRRLPAPRH